MHGGMEGTSREASPYPDCPGSPASLDLFIGKANLSATVRENGSAFRVFWHCPAKLLNWIELSGI